MLCWNNLSLEPQILLDEIDERGNFTRIRLVACICFEKSGKVYFNIANPFWGLLARTWPTLDLSNCAFQQIINNWNSQNIYFCSIVLYLFLKDFKEKLKKKFDPLTREKRLFWCCLGHFWSELRLAQSYILYKLYVTQTRPNVEYCFHVWGAIILQFRYVCCLVVSGYFSLKSQKNGFCWLCIFKWFESTEK